MATHHGGAGLSLDRDSAQHGQDTDIPNDYHHEDIDNFENAEQESPHQPENPYLGARWFTATEFRLVKVNPHGSHQLHRVHEPSQIIHSTSFISTTRTSWWCTTAIHRNLMLCLKADHLCMNTLIQNIPTFNSSNSMQLEDWLVDIKTAANLTDESRTKLAWAKSKGLTCTIW